MAISSFVIFIAIYQIFSWPSLAKRVLNPIDDCALRKDWADNRMKLAECAYGFGARTNGGRGGTYYLVNNTNDDNPADPAPGTLRHAVTREGPLWIVFSEGEMYFKLYQELIINSYKTIDGRGSDVHFQGPACLVLQEVEDVILHNLHVYNCQPTGGDGTMVRSNEHHFGRRGRTEGDAVSLYTARNVWVDHLFLAKSNDGLIDAVEGSTNITVSNCHLHDHNEAMLFGHDDKYLEDRNLQATFAYNLFTDINQRCPRGRLGNLEVVNNVYKNWGMYAVGGSAGVTIRSEGNIYNAPDNEKDKEVTKRITCDNCDKWNWISENDWFRNGAYFRPSGSTDPNSDAYAKARSIVAMDPKDIYKITRLAGPMQCVKDRKCHK